MDYTNKERMEKKKAERGRKQRVGKKYENGKKEFTEGLQKKKKEAMEWREICKERGKEGKE